MGSCWRCGEENSPRAVFCMVCGVRLEGEVRPKARKPATILFNDVAGSTSLGERFEPEAVRQIMSSYFAAVWRVCERHGGTVEKFIGDAVMAVFGIPIAQEDHALRAIRAAAALRDALPRLNEELERDWGVRIATRTGVSSGEVVAGDPAGGEFLVTGDAVNVAARLEQAAAAGEILIGDATRRLVAEAVEVEHIEPLAIKGKSEPVAVWRLLEVTSRASRVERLDAPMLGRDRELELLREKLERVSRERSAHRVTVLGPAGIGKSRLAHELAVAVGDRASVLSGSCLPYGEGITFWPLAEIVRQAAGQQPSATIAKLLAGDRHAEVIANRVSQAVGISEGGGDGKDLTWAIRKFLEALARRHPVVLVFEDIHWAEPDLLDLIEYLTERTRDAPLLLLCLAREELLEQRPAWVRQEHEASSITLQPLSHGETEILVKGLLAERAVDERVRAQLVERAEGNPLFVEQMLALLREGADADHLAIPPTIQALLAARLDRLAVDELAVVGAASVVGREFWPTAVSVLLPADEAARVNSVLPTLVRKELIGADSSTLTGEDGFSFRHALIRDAAYEALTKERRAELHERFAGWMEDRYRDRLVEFEAILGYHFEQAHKYRVELAPVDERTRSLGKRGARRLASAGQRAARAREDATAVNLLSRASKLLPASANERLELLSVIGESLEGTANHGRAGEIYAEALDGAIAAGNRGVEGRARLGRAHVWFITQPEISTAQIAAEAERAIALLEEAGDEEPLAQAWRLVGEARMYEGQAASGQRALERALGHLGPDPPPRSWNAVAFATGMCLLDGPRPLDRAVTFAEEQLELARPKGLRSLEADMLHVLGLGEARRGRFEPARLALANSTAISEELGLAYMAQWSKQSLGLLELAAGDPQAAERALRESHAVMVEMGLNSNLGETVVPLADALFEQGRYDEATRMLETIKEDWASGDTKVEAPRLNVRAKLFAAQGWDQHAERSVRRALRLVQETDWACLQADTLLAHAEVLRLGDRGAEAVPSLREALRIAEAKGYAVLAGKAAGRLEELGQQAAGRVP